MSIIINNIFTLTYELKIRAAIIYQLCVFSFILIVNNAFGKLSSAFIPYSLNLNPVDLLDCRVQDSKNKAVKIKFY